LRLAKQKENSLVSTLAGLFICKIGRIGPNSAMVGQQFGQREQPITPPERAGFQGTRMTNFRTAMIAMGVAAALAGSQAVAADGTLAPGKPAGVHQAARSPRLWLIGGAALAVVAGVGIAIANSNNSQCGAACVTPSTTGTTS
jgi:hypothetical protein